MSVKLSQMPTKGTPLKSAQDKQAESTEMLYRNILPKIVEWICMILQSYTLLTN